MKINETEKKSLRVVQDSFSAADRSVSFARKSLGTLNMRNEADPDENGDEKDNEKIEPVRFLNKRQEREWNRLPQHEKKTFLNTAIRDAKHTGKGNRAKTGILSAMQKDVADYPRETSVSEGAYSCLSYYKRSREQKKAEKKTTIHAKKAEGISSGGTSGQILQKTEQSVFNAQPDSVKTELMPFEKTIERQPISAALSYVEAGTAGTATAGTAFAISAGRKAAASFKEYLEASSSFSQSAACRAWERAEEVKAGKTELGFSETAAYVGSAMAAGILSVAAIVVQAVTSLLTSLLAALLSVVAVVILIALVVVSLAVILFSAVQQQSSNAAGYNLPGFITEEMMEAFFETQEENGIPVSTGIAQMIGESGFGLYGPGGESGQGMSKLAYDYKNLFGIKYFSEDSYATGFVSMVTGEETAGGESYEIVDDFSVYDNYADCIRQRAWMLSREPYASFVAPYLNPNDGSYTEQDAHGFLEGIRAGGWATSHSYIENCISLMDQYNLYQFDNMTWEQYQAGITASGGTYDGTVTPLMQTIADVARNNQGTIGTEPNMCAAWVTGVYQAAGASVVPWGDAIDMWNTYQLTGSTSMENIPPGAIVCGSGSGSMGAIYGHVGIYIGDGLVANNKNGFEIETLSEWCSWQDAMCQGHVGWIGWIFPGGVPAE